MENMEAGSGFKEKKGVNRGSEGRGVENKGWRYLEEAKESMDGVVGSEGRMEGWEKKC